MSKCIYCGHAVSDGEAYCTNCGAKVEEKSEMTFKKEETNESTQNGQSPTYNVSTERQNKKYDDTPLSLGMAIGFVVLMCIPGVNLIMAIVWACGASKNRNLINLSRASLIVMIIVYAVVTITSVAAFTWVANSPGLDTFLTEVIDDMNKESGGALAQFGIDSFDDLRDFSDMTDEEKYQKVDEIVGGNLSDYGINDYNDLKKAADDGSLEEILEKNGIDFSKFEEYGKSYYGENNAVVDEAA